MLLYASFTTGFQRAIARMLPSALRVLDGGVLYTADATAFTTDATAFTADATASADASWAHNTFAVLAWKENPGTLEAFAKRIADGKGWDDGATRRLPAPPENTRFRVVVSDENRLVSLDAGIKKRVEAVITRHTGLLPDRGGGGVEYWLLRRSEGFLFFMRRLTYHPAYDKSLPKGALTPPLAYMLNYLAAPQAGEILLDPFCGSGAIGAAARAHFPWGAVRESDLRTGRDARDLPTWLEAGSIDKIVTDPPWGLYGEALDIPALYADMLGVFARVLRPGGTAVILTARKAELLDALALAANGAFSLTERYDILVNGKKAGVFVLGMQPRPA